MQDDSGLKRVMSFSMIYDHFQNAVGARALRKWMAENYWKLRGGEKVVDVGCGPGVILENLPPSVKYFGFDINQGYVASAIEKYGDRGTFLVGTAEDFVSSADNPLMNADLVLCNGLLHHLDDTEASNVMRLANRILSPGGRLVCIEPVLLVRQGIVSRWIMGMDRGKNIRSETEWKELVGRAFTRFGTSIAVGLIRLPYVHIIIECQQ